MDCFQKPTVSFNAISTAHNHSLIYLFNLSVTIWMRFMIGWGVCYWDIIGQEEWESKKCGKLLDFTCLWSHSSNFLIRISLHFAINKPNINKMSIILKQFVLLFLAHFFHLCVWE